MTEKETFIRMLATVMNSYKRELSQSEILLWCGILEKNSISYRDALEALEHHLMDPEAGKYAPKLADLSGYINGTKGSKQLEAIEAWALVDDAVRRAGPYRDVVFQDAAIHTAINMLGGWEVLNNCESDQELRFLGKDFEKCYTIALQKTGHPNILRGSQPGDRAPYLAGDRDKCIAVLRGTDDHDKPKLPPINVKSLDGDNE